MNAFCGRLRWVFYGVATTAQCAGSLAVACVFVAAGGFVLNVRFNSHSGRKTVELDARNEDRNGEI